MWSDQNVQRLSPNALQDSLFFLSQTGLEEVSKKAFGGFVAKLTIVSLLQLSISAASVLSTVVQGRIKQIFYWI